MKTSKILKSILTFSTVIAVFVTSILPFKKSGGNSRLLVAEMKAGLLLYV